MQNSRALGIHRNAVGQRIARAEWILGTALHQPETRLALQLALRVVRAGPPVTVWADCAPRRPAALDLESASGSTVGA